MQLGPHILEAILNAVRQTSTREIGCDDCFEQVDKFAELHLAGKSAADALPLVDAHLRNCRECREEFEALGTALAAISRPTPR